MTAVLGPVNESTEEENEELETVDRVGEGDDGCATSELKSSHESETPAATAPQTARRRVNADSMIRGFESRENNSK